MFSVAEIVISLLLIALVLIQERSSGISGVFGGGGSDSSYQTRRGTEKMVFVATIVAAIAFVAISIVKPVFSAAEADQILSALVYGSFERLIESVASDDPSIYSVTLKENLFWSDGKPLTSDDVIFTVEAMQNPEMRSPLFKNWQGIVVERISELQVRFILPSSYVFFRENLNRLQVVPEHIW